MLLLAHLFGCTEKISESLKNEIFEHVKPFSPYECPEIDGEVYGACTNDVATGSLSALGGFVDQFDPGPGFESWDGIPSDDLYNMIEDGYFDMTFHVAYHFTERDPNDDYDGVHNVAVTIYPGNQTKALKKDAKLLGDLLDFSISNLTSAKTDPLRCYGGLIDGVGLFSSYSLSCLGNDVNYYDYNGVLEINTNTYSYSPLPANYADDPDYANLLEVSKSVQSFGLKTYDLALLGVDLATDCVYTGSESWCHSFYFYSANSRPHYKLAD